MMRERERERERERVREREREKFNVFMLIEGRSSLHKRFSIPGVSNIREAK